MILLDTHVLIWHATGSARLGTRSRRLCDEALQEGDLGVSAISFWEVALLERRFAPGVPMPEWRRAFLSRGLIEVPLAGDMAIRATELEGLSADPADRMIAATALIQDATLLTADRRILEWDGPLKTSDATR